jgi:hypothetical protein
MTVLLKAVQSRSVFKSAFHIPMKFYEFSLCNSISYIKSTFIITVNFKIAIS